MQSLGSDCMLGKRGGDYFFLIFIYESRVRFKSTGVPSLDPSLNISLEDPDLCAYLGSVMIPPWLDLWLNYFL